MIAIFIAALALLGCEKPQDNKNDLGEPTSVAAIQRAQNASISRLDPATVRVGQISHQVETQEIVTSQGPLSALASEWVTKVQMVEEIPSAIVLTIAREYIDHLEPTKPKFEFQDVLGFANSNKDFRQTAADDMTLSLRLFNSDTPAQKSEAVKITEVSFHNLLTRQVVVQPPPLVRDSPDCRGLSPCQITADQINYEVVFYLSDGSLAKHQIEWLISSQVPFFSSILKQCASTIVPVDSIRVLVKQCQQVVDFKF